MHTSLVSVVIPVYNGETYLVETLESVLNQTYPHTEVITVDDGSTDTSAEIIGRYPQIRYVCEENGGVAIARNNGLRLAQGDYLALLDQDDLWDPRKLEFQVDFLEKHPETGIVSSLLQFFLQEGIEKPDWVRAELLESPRPGYLGNFLIRRDVITRVGFFDPQYTLASDHDWFMRAADAGVKMEYIDTVLLHKRVHRHNESQREESTREMLRIHRQSIQRKKHQTNIQGPNDG